jgi:hypothetical protein
MAADSRRLSILAAREIEDLYGLPRLTEADRLLYFDLSPAEHKAVDGLHTASAAVHLVVQLGYFKAKRPSFRNNSLPSWTSLFVVVVVVVVAERNSSATARSGFRPGHSFWAFLPWPG